ncbi:MAG TPA: exosortase/archaeosortase family protein, partial [Candidatus Acidoferrales bacterium]|nr:exosortase/archaeosortase family protein [Candidatus Acidoferrales bacterium]
MTDPRLATRHGIFAGFVLASGLIFWKTWATLIAYSLGNESASHILLIPPVVLCLFFLERKRIFLRSTFAIDPGLAVVASAIVIFWLAARSRDRGNGALSIETLCLVSVWIGGFVSCYGLKVSRAAIVPLLYLLRMVPWPSAVLDRVIYWLQEGSTDVTYAIFKAVGVPVFRQGFVLTVPGV